MPIPLGVLAVAGAGAGGGGSAFDLLETTILGTDSTSVVFNNLNNYADYKHLQFRMTVRGVGSATLLLRFNNITTTTYNGHQIEGNGGSVSTFAQTTDDWIRFGQLETSANIANSHIVDIYDFSSGNKNKTTRSFHADPANRVEMRSGLFRSTSAITRIDFFVVTGSMAANSRFSLYGIKG